MFFGTVEYASIRTHQSMNQSRKDDLETLGYSILDLMTNGEYGFLSVERSVINDDLHLSQINAKNSFVKNTSLPSKFSYLREYMKVVQDLSFNQNPDYDKLRSLLQILFTNHEEKMSTIQATLLSHLCKQLLIR